jgi:hypothetical protein
MATRTFHYRVSDFMWGEPDPPPAERRHLEQVRGGGNVPRRAP